MSFVVIEGPDNSGKSTQVELVAEKIGAIATREPGGTDFGMALRELIMDYATDIDQRAVNHLFIADRYQHLTEVVLPAVSNGKVVISDRFDLSTIAYTLVRDTMTPTEIDDLLSACKAARLVEPAVCIVLFPIEPYDDEVRNSFDEIEFSNLRACYQYASQYVDYPVEVLVLENQTEEEVSEQIIGRLYDYGVI